MVKFTKSIIVIASLLISGEAFAMKEEKDEKLWVALVRKENKIFVVREENKIFVVAKKDEISEVVISGVTKKDKKSKQKIVVDTDLFMMEIQEIQENYNTKRVNEKLVSKRVEEFQQKPRGQNRDRFYRKKGEKKNA